MFTLDVGCGQHKRGDIGVDYSKLSSADVIADACHLPFRNDVFDKVISVVVLEHSPNPFSFIKEQYRVLKHGGKLELITDNAQYYRWSVLGFRGAQHEKCHGDHYMIFYPKNVERLLSRANFINVSTRYIKAGLDKMDFIILLLIKMKVLRKECIFKRFKAVAVKDTRI